MEKNKFIQKPLLTIIVLIAIVAAIFYFQSTKTSVNKKAVDNAIKQQQEEKKTQANSQMTQTEAEKQADASKKLLYPKAPDFAGIDKWINSEPLKMAQLKGKIVLVDDSSTLPFQKVLFSASINIYQLRWVLVETK